MVHSFNCGYISNLFKLYYKLYMNLTPTFCQPSFLTWLPPATQPLLGRLWYNRRLTPGGYLCPKARKKTCQEGHHKHLPHQHHLMPAVCERIDCHGASCWTSLCISGGRFMGESGSKHFGKYPFNDWHFLILKMSRMFSREPWSPQNWPKWCQNMT